MAGAPRKLEYEEALGVLQSLIGHDVVVIVAHESTLRGAPFERAATLGGVLHRAQTSWQGGLDGDQLAFHTSELLRRRSPTGFATVSAPTTNCPS
jgi:hypothetical protein